ncbi:YiiX/YebB-like N1pC/P60 family cysteine hydrolase [Sphingobacterium yanglingense]|uniref:Permuted papain-like amidase YaeF/Yiix C92 family enzyme n=1 Tax=Sphingobacterium yanglingense TaxID=1437280 RepID=A0A4R6W8E1_9SPHI|nr:YiiX/YebB-like N1pC/P60 family cysteine hydrolase [Sphingobacterium yanglingense]TDQ73886.1 permuted papain-like amidase YaeF/Yiix C92 family enzyme [Sphingobacterium yanglingense]
MKKATILLILLGNMLLLHAQSNVEYKGVSIANGDFLFFGAQAQNLSGAINRVTQLKDSISFSHIGLIEVIEGVPYLLHSIGNKGSVKESLDNLTKYGKGQQYVVYRIDSIHSHAIPRAMEIAHEMLGKPYNWSYKLNDSSYYCSDFVERAFRPIGLFKLEPMTFKNPVTGELDEFWVKFYAKQGLEVPEGELGCNPNGLAANPNIHRVGTLQTTK